MYYGITDLTTYVIGTIFIILLPGPNSLYVLSVAVRRGIRSGYQGAFGVFLGDAILMILAATGVASLLESTPALFVLVKYAGALYLAWLGMNMLRGAFIRLSEDANLVTPPDTRDATHPFRTALTISLLNPKAIFFFISFFIQFVDPAYEHPALSFAILGLIVQFFSALYLSALIFGGAHLADQFRRRRLLSAGATAGVGTLFLAFGAKLAGATLH
ncbi:MAG: leucine efflux protein LeuE [Rhodocyclaceae bacterium]|nr:leucine efflux protein LeuE [Rhodocyclaceae bacterium]MBP7080100.1 leucine efflux protein LeuE [Rhodocyclaceae bacterium]